ncbi:fasciclin domain-containing protein [Allohahella marinimesophila]|uniref:FAS1 domain-containing protein n=1 Tax=Allohahella marinimesophila TaxID=1054972 RepID=A0ABP7PDG8_9GAMM
MKHLMRPLKLVVVLTSAMLLAACSDDDDDDRVPLGSIVDVAVANGNFTTLVATLEATGLDATLDDPDASFTVFAPSDAAFDKLGESTINALLADTEMLSEILQYHVVSGRVDSAAAIAAAGTTVDVVNGDKVALSLDGETLLVNAATVTITDVQADNGIIHAIDAVLMPPAVKGTPTANIVETAVAAGDFGTLVTALQAAGLDSVLADPNRTFTVFAPSDAAFAKLGTDAINALLADSAALMDVLLQHVIGDAEVNSVQAFSLNGQRVDTESGKTVAVDIDPETDTLSVGGATLTTTDIYTTNGVIHVIDTVITNGE